VPFRVRRPAAPRDPGLHPLPQHRQGHGAVPQGRAQYQFHFIATRLGNHQAGGGADDLEE
jgi:hypothetical protein